MNLYLVGGAVRQHLLGQPTQDFDYAVEAESFETMRSNLLAKGLTIWQERPQFVTLRGRLPAGSLGDFGGVMYKSPDESIPGDFTLCRAEAMYSDRRHPDSVTPATLETDLSRRDFTMNAIAVSERGKWIDPFGGAEDIKRKLIRCVGSAGLRFNEDPLRMLRAVRFAVLNRMALDVQIEANLHDYDMVEKISTLPVERVFEEMNKMLRHDWRTTMLYMIHEFPALGDVIASNYPNLWLKATTEER